MTKLLIFLFAVCTSFFPCIAGVPPGAEQVADYNGDGIDDYLLVNPEAGGNRNTGYDLYLSDKKSGKHHKFELFATNGRWDSKEKVLTSTMYGGGGRTYFTEVYSFASGQPKLIKTIRREEETINWKCGGFDVVFTVTTRVLVGKHWKVTVEKE